MNQNDVKYIAMGDDDIRYYLPKATIITYDELSNCKQIEDLLPKHKSYFILLYPVQSVSSGHWISVTRFDKTIEYCDSYGEKPDAPLMGQIQKNDSLLI